mgnify:CR=1 FL=1
MAQVYLAGDLRNGVTFEMGSSVYRVIEFQHVKPGKGPAFIRTKIRNVMTGAVIEKTFNPTERFQGAEIIKEEMQYLYNDGEFYYFMNTETYEQIQLTEEQLGDALKYIKENMNVTTLTYKDKVFAVEPPLFVELEVTYTEPGFSGNTSSSTTKPATVETGTQVNVPLFVEIGDRIKIDTRTGEYMERV